MRARHPNRKSSRGFSLIESLIALAIASAVMTAYFESLSTALTLDRRSRAQADAALLAASLLDEVGAEIPLEPLSRDGTTSSNGRYRLTISPGATLDARLGGTPPATDGLVTVEIIIDGPELATSYRVVSLRLANGTLK
jgi:prepilin-type N-terminal cleavage/methylation domain-containing protein